MERFTIIYLLLLALGLFACSADSPIGVVSTPGPIYTFVDSAFFMDKFGTSHVKIAFNDEERNELNYIEFDNNEFRHEIIKTQAIPNHPQFSPDGSKLAFSTGHEGLTEVTEMYFMRYATNRSIPSGITEAEMICIPMPIRFFLL